MSVQLVNDARRIAFYMEDDLHGIKQLAQAIFLIVEQIEYERCQSDPAHRPHHDRFCQHPESSPRCFSGSAEAMLIWSRNL